MTKPALCALLLVLGVSTCLAIECSSLTVSSWSGPSDTCAGADGSKAHYWPTGYLTSDCHGWEATDPNGKVHLNSAKNIMMSTDCNTLMYDQYANSISCEGTPTSKKFIKGECHQGVPPSLYDTLLDTSCCVDRGSACLDKMQGVPVVMNDATSNQKIYKNGELCDAGKAPANAGDVTVNGSSGNGESPAPSAASATGRVAGYVLLVSALVAALFGLC